MKLNQQRVHARDCQDCDTNIDGFVHRIERSVTLEGDLDEAQRKRLLEISHMCPVHKTLTSPIVIRDA